ncbi:MAG: hypothetical protein M1816_003679 [Peltula sp. TS41687]|nr:MAG: hypothetical protein M1816_003679 [Peltula sp. TS41687]
MPGRTAPDTATIGDRQIDIVPLESIDYARLAAKEPAELEKLLDAARSPGFFYVDLRNNSTLVDLRELYAVAEQYFDQPDEVKMKNDRGGPAQRGYYKAGTQGEAFEIARDEIVQKQPALDGLLGDRAELLERFSTQCDTALRTMLSCLSDALGLDENDRFENSHRADQPSDCSLMMFNGPSKSKMADAPDNQHTDTGSLTLFYCDKWGVQLQLPETGQWVFVEPKSDQVLINVGDRLQSRSGGRLHSCKHRVTQPVDGFQRRFFVLYYLRPSKE